MGQTVTIEEVKQAAEWRLAGTEVHMRPYYTLVSKCVIGNQMFIFMNSHLGSVQLRNDGRWNWFVKVVQYNSFWTATEPKQGVAEDKESAMKKVESYWASATV